MKNNCQGKTIYRISDYVTKLLKLKLSCFCTQMGLLHPWNKIESIRKLGSWNKKRLIYMKGGIWSQQIKDELLTHDLVTKVCFETIGLDLTTLSSKKAKNRGTKGLTVNYIAQNSPCLVQGDKKKTDFYWAYYCFKILYRTCMPTACTLDGRLWLPVRNHLKVNLWQVLCGHVRWHFCRSLLIAGDRGIWRVRGWRCENTDTFSEVYF